MSLVTLLPSAVFSRALARGQRSEVNVNNPLNDSLVRASGAMRCGAVQCGHGTQRPREYPDPRVLVQLHCS
jgi:hypothetical protein